MQIPLDEMSFEELVQYRAMHVANPTTAAESAKVVERLLELQAKAPGAKTPRAACRKLGLNPADVMAGAA